MSKMMVKRDGLWTPMANLKGDTGPLPADNSVTNDALVTDGAKTNTAYLMGNRLTATAEGEMVSVDDSYPSAALSLTVDGKSSQLTTTGKNLLSTNESDWVVRATPNGSRPAYVIPVESGASYHWNSDIVVICGVYWVNDPEEYSEAVSAGADRHLSTTFINSEGYRYLLFVRSSNASVAGWTDILKNYNVIVERGNAFTSYEPYTGGKPAPSPDYPQEIISVDSSVLRVHNKNLIKPNATRLTGYGVTVTIDSDGWISVTGTSTAAGRIIALYINDGTVFELRPNTTYTHSIYGQHNNVAFALYTTGGGGYLSIPADRDSSTVTVGNSSFYINRVAVIFNAGVTIDAKFRFQVELGSAASEYEPYSGGVGSLLPEGTSLRSLPDGTKDELYLKYLRPSSRAGWAFYKAEKTQRIATQNCSGGNENWKIYSNYAFCKAMPNVRVMKTGRKELLCDAYKSDVSTSLGSARTDATSPDTIFGRNGEKDAIIKTSVAYATVNDFKAALAENPIIIQYALAAPQTIDFGEIELPIMQAGITNIWTDPSTSLSVTYERDRNIVISKLEAAAADLATS